LWEGQGKVPLSLRVLDAHEFVRVGQPRVCFDGKRAKAVHSFEEKKTWNAIWSLQVFALFYIAIIFKQRKGVADSRLLAGVSSGTDGVSEVEVREEETTQDFHW